jgi:hypothetical protein
MSKLKRIIAYLLATGETEAAGICEDTLVESFDHSLNYAVDWREVDGYSSPSL